MERMLPGDRSNRPIRGLDPRLDIRPGSAEVPPCSDDDAISLFSVATRGVAKDADEAVVEAQIQLERAVSVGNATKEYNLRRLSEAADSVEAQYQRELSSRNATSAETVAAITELARASHLYLSSDSSRSGSRSSRASMDVSHSSDDSLSSAEKLRRDGMCFPGPYSPPLRSDGMWYSHDAATMRLYFPDDSFASSYEGEGSIPDDFRHHCDLPRDHPSWKPPRPGQKVKELLSAIEAVQGSDAADHQKKRKEVSFKFSDPINESHGPPPEEDEVFSPFLESDPTAPIIDVTDSDDSVDGDEGENEERKDESVIEIPPTPGPMVSLKAETLDEALMVGIKAKLENIVTGAKSAGYPASAAVGEALLSELVSLPRPCPAVSTAPPSPAASNHTLDSSVMILSSEKG